MGQYQAAVQEADDERAGDRTNHRALAAEQRSATEVHSRDRAQP